MISVDGAFKTFGRVRALAGVDLHIGRGELVALLGPSGCGKTTLLRVIAGFEAPDAGTLRVGGRIVAGAGTWIAPEQRRVGIVFQDYALFPHLTVARNIGFGLPRQARRARVQSLLAIVGLDGLEGRYPHELSGGQQQRVALARALAPQPDVILLDEPWSNIDPLLRQSMREELAEILRSAGATVLLVTHDREEAFSISDRVALMSGGAVVQAGVAEDLYLRPMTRWAAEFAGAGNFLPGRLVDGTVETPLGAFPALNANGARSVEALIRPERVELRTDPAGSATVVARQFRGHDVFYRVRLADGMLILSQRPSTETVPLGARVAVHAHAGSVPVFSP